MSRIDPRRRAGLVEAFGPLAITIVASVAVYSWSQSASYHQDIVVLAAVYALTSLGMYLPFNMAGSLSLAYSGYLTVGAYAVGIVSIHTDWPVLWGWLIGAVVAGTIALLLGLVTMKLSGFYLAGVTLLAASVFTAFIIDQDGLTRGATGIQGIRYSSIFGYQLSREAFVWLGITVVIIAAFLLDRLRRSPVGISIVASKHAPRMVDSLGVSSIVLRLTSLTLGAALAATGGALFASFNRVIRPDTFPLHFALIAIFMPLLGGSGTAFGAVLGALVVTDLTANRPELQQFGPLIFAALVVVILLLAPNGIAGAINRLRISGGRLIMKAVGR